VVIGDALIDEIHRDGSVEEFVGGAALNVAVGLSVLGVPSTLIAMIGDDSDGTRIRDFLEQHHVTLIPTIGPNGTSRAISDRVNGEPVYAFNAAAQARRISFRPAERAALDAAPLVAVSSFPFDDVEQSSALAGAIKDPGKRLAIDPNPRAGMLHDRKRFRQTFDRIAPNTLLVKVGSDDAKIIYNCTVEQLATDLHDRHTRAVIGTAGADGAFVETEAGNILREPVADLPGPIIDTIGAGDATLASLIQSIVDEGYPTTNDAWQVALHRAMRIAAATCRHEGALLQVPVVAEAEVTEAG
jgi:fructokinase